MQYLLPILFAALTWWLTTVLMLHRSLRAQPRCRTTLLVVSLIAIAGVLALGATRELATPMGACVAFLGALGLWAWMELSYFLGFVTGPRPRACPEGTTPLQRFVFGVRASLWHELAIIVCGTLLFFWLLDAANPIGLWTFVILWTMRWSAKMNIFLGVRNLHQEFWPRHLRYLGSYVREADSNPLFPWTLLLAGSVLVTLLVRAAGASGQAFEVTGLMLLASLLALGLAEHVLLMLRLPDAWLWRPALEGLATDEGASKLDHELSPGRSA